jgi:hypothetical protein
VSGSWHRSFRRLISFWVLVKLFFTIPAYDVIVIRSGTCACIFRRGRDGHVFWDSTLRFCSFFLVLRSWKGDQMPPLRRSICRFPFRQSGPKIRSSSLFRPVPTRFLELSGFSSAR